MKSWKPAKILSKKPLIVKSRQRGDILGLYTWEDETTITYSLNRIGHAKSPNATPCELPKGFTVMEHDGSGILSIYRKNTFN